MIRIRELREELGLTQAGLASRLSMGRATLGLYEQEKRSIVPETIKRFCAFFGVTSDYLLGLSDRRTPGISDADAELVAAYHAAPASVRAGIDALLQPYREEKGSSASPVAKGG